MDQHVSERANTRRRWLTREWSRRAADRGGRAPHSQRYTIGGMMVFPGNRIDGKWTIYQARGCTRKVGDRFDLTLEGIRRHYNKGDSPLSSVLARYATFFELFHGSRGYVDFFLLQDLVVADGSAVKIALPFDDFRGSPIPGSVEEYRLYKNEATAFIEARNRRMLHSL